MKLISYIGIGATAITLAGCASSPDDMSAASVSPLKYRDYSCDQIAMEMDYTSEQTTKLYNQLEKKANDDAAQMTVGMVLFWPALFFLEGGDGPQAAEYSQLKGNYNALRRASIKKECGFDSPDTLEEKMKAEMHAEA